jgi:hypothetical protein
VFSVKRLALATSVVVALLLPGSAVARGAETTVERIPVDFVLSSDVCPNLPPDTTITGSGIEKSITRTSTRGGVTTIFNTSVAPGSATDQDGNRYRFLYFNQFRVSNTTAEPDLFRGVMVDRFLLRGRGPARLSNGFTANITTNFADVFTFDPISSFGDPLNFETGEGICDPL